MVAIWIFAFIIAPFLPLFATTNKYFWCLDQVVYDGASKGYIINVVFVIFIGGGYMFDTMM